MRLPPTHEPRNLANVLSDLAELTDVHYWRGQADEAWTFDSTIVRRLQLTRPGRPADEKAVRFWEKRMLEKARVLGHDIVDGLRLDDFELLALLRHHGAATRLVDFSRNALVALWFACSDKPKATGTLLGVHTDFIASHETDSLIDLGSTYDPVMQSVALTRDLYTWQPRRVSQRVAAQNSQFLFSQVSSEGYGTTILPVDNTNGVVVMRIDPTLKQTVLSFLQSALDIWHHSLFPDLPGFAATYSASNADGEDRW